MNYTDYKNSAIKNCSSSEDSIVLVEAFEVLENNGEYDFSKVTDVLVNTKRVLGIEDTKRLIMYFWNSKVREASKQLKLRQGLETLIMKNT